MVLQESCCAVGTGKCRHWGGPQEKCWCARVCACVPGLGCGQMGWECTLSFPSCVSWPSDGGGVDLPTLECSQRERSMIQPP